MIVEILCGTLGSVLGNAIYGGIKKITRKDPFKNAFNGSVDEIRKKQGEYFAVFDELKENPDKFVTSKVIDKETFCEILSREGVVGDVASELYDKINQEFNNIIEETRKENEVLFRYYVEDELKRNGAKLGEISEGVYRIKETLTKITIPNIESILEKGKSQEPRFFRPSGPEWIDFEEGFVFERTEVDKIIEKFENKDLVAIKGGPASGKSVILRNIGFKLANQCKYVFVIELKRTLLERSEVLKLQRGYLFIDDAHLNPEYVDDLVRNLSGVKILISTRDIKFGPASSLKMPEYLKDAIEIKGHDATEGIIQKFSEKKKKGIPGKIKKKLTKNNLWILAWELETYEEFNRFDENAICERVKDYIRKDLKNLKVRNAENVFLPLSVFYRCEIPLRKEFVEEFAEYADIEKLIELNEINKTEENGFEYLTLYHSETAKVFLKTFQRFDGFGNKVKDRVGGDWFEGLFHLYIQEVPRECVDVISMLGRLRYREFELIKNLVEENFDKVREGIEAEEDVGKIGSCVGGMNIRSNEVAEKLIKSLDVENLKSKIEAEKDVQKIGWCIWKIHKGSNEVAEKLVKSLDVENLKSKIEAEDGVERIGWYVEQIVEISEKLSEKLIPAVKDKIEAEKDVRKIGWYVGWIAVGSNEVAEKLVKSLDLEKLKKKIEAEKDVRKIGWCVGNIARGSEELAEKLIPILKRKIEAEDDFEKIDLCIREIAWRSEELASKLAN